MDKYLFFIGAVILLIVFFLFRCNIESSPTLSSIVGGLFLILVSAGLIPWYQDNYLNQPDLQIVDAIDAQESLTLKEISKDVYQISLAVKNNGRLPIKDKFYWHLIIPVPYNPNFTKARENTDEDGYQISPFERNGISMTKVSGWSSGKIYARSRVANFHTFTFVCKNPENLPDKIYYYFSTEFGYSPRSAYQYDEAFEKSKGEEKQIEYLNTVNINKLSGTESTK